ELTRVGRTNWFALLAYQTFAFITILGVEDADFFIDSRQTQLPLIGVDIPTFSFFLFAPALGAALYIYLHLHIRKLIAAIAEPPPRVQGMPLEEHLSSWLLNDVLLRWRGDGAAIKRPLDWLAVTATITLIWLAGPFVQFAFYWRSWPAHEELVTLYLAATALLTLHAGLTSWTLAWRIRGTPRWSPARTVARLLAVGVIAGGAGWLGWIKTESGIVPPIDSMGSRLATVWHQTLAPINMIGLQSSVLPPEERDPTVARQRFRAEYCARLGIEAEVCGRLPASGSTAPEFHEKLREDWCADRNTTEGCLAYFARLDREFSEEWRELRRNKIASLPKPTFRIKDLRNLSATSSLLTGVDLSAAQLEGADLRGAQMEGADLRGAQLEGAVLRDAQLEGAVLRDAQMEGAVLRDVQLEGADLRDAQLEGAVLRGAQLEAADLSRARMEGADLIDAQMDGATLSDAQMEGAVLFRARMERAVLFSAQLKWAVLTDTQMQGADLRNAQLEGADLSGARMEGADLSFARMEGAVLRVARMEGADLSSARMDGAVLFRAQMERADLSDARMDGAVLFRARMEGAVLDSAQMEGAVLRNAQMEGADLSGARMDGAVLRGAQMTSVSWGRTSLRGALLQDSILTGARDLTQRQLDGAIGNDSTVLPAANPPFRIASCWEREPYNFAKTLTAYNSFTFPPLTTEEASARWICSEDNPRVLYIGPLP
ncbi:MAG: pentapeptide repeat-containing protein, partial [Pseudomonadota bacterium]